MEGSRTVSNRREQQEPRSSWPKQKESSITRKGPRSKTPEERLLQSQQDGPAAAASVPEHTALGPCSCHAAVRTGRGAQHNHSAATPAPKTRAWPPTLNPASPEARGKTTGATACPCWRRALHLVSPGESRGLSHARGLEEEAPLTRQGQREGQGHGSRAPASRGRTVGVVGGHNSKSNPVETSRLVRRGARLRQRNQNAAKEKGSPTKQVPGGLRRRARYGNTPAGPPPLRRPPSLPPATLLFPGTLRAPLASLLSALQWYPPYPSPTTRGRLHQQGCKVFPPRDTLSPGS